MLSQEKNSKEVNWSLGTYIKKEEVQKAFGVKNLPKPWNVAPNQPYEGGGLIKYGFLLLGILLIVGIFMIPFTGFSSTRLNQEVLLQPMKSATASQVIFSQPFELEGSENVQITAAAPVSNSWAELNIDLVKEGNNDVESVLIPIEYYYGVSGGESWREGGKVEDATISAVPEGKYTLRIEGVWKDWTKPLPVRVIIKQNVTRGVNFILAFIFLAIGPIIGLFKKFAFESRRWSESMFGGSG